jgi:hypothetical protein
LGDQQRAGAAILGLGLLDCGWRMVGEQGQELAAQPLERHMTRLGAKTIEFDSFGSSV